MVANNECEVNNGHVLDANDTNDANADNKAHEQCEWMAPGAQGLYDPQNEHEACGVGFIVAIDGKPSHKVCVSASATQHFLSIFMLCLTVSELYDASAAGNVWRCVANELTDET